MNRHRPKGVRVTDPVAARSSVLRTSAPAGTDHPDTLRGTVASAFRLIGLVTVVIGAFLALAASPAFAVVLPAGEIAGSAPGVPFSSLKSESVAVSDFDGHIYVADSGTHRIYDFASALDTAPTVWDGTATPTGEFQGSLSVAVDNTTGDVYVGDSSVGVIDEFGPDGNLITGFGDTTPTPDGQLRGLATPAGGFSPAAEGSFGIAVDQATGDLYAIDAGHGEIDVFDATGAYLEASSKALDEAGVPAAAAEGLFECGGAYTDGIAVDDKSGELLLSQSCTVRAYRLALTGAFIATITGSETPARSFGGAFTSLTADNGSGAVYVNDIQHEVVDEFNSAGKYTGQLTGLPSGSFGGLAVDQATNDLYVADAGSGSVKIFAEPLPGPPLIDSTSVADVTATSAELLAEVNPHLLATTYHFEYGTAECGPNPCTATPERALLGSDFADHPATAAIQGLPPATTYHYRLVAENPLGTVPGPDRTFTTQSAVAALLPDDRGWELVSPPNKHGALLTPIGIGSLIQAAADGSAITYSAKGSVSLSPEGAVPPNSGQVISKRSPGAAWASQEITSRKDSVSVAGAVPSEYRLFSTDLSEALLEPPSATLLSPQASEHTPYLRDDGAPGQFCQPAGSCYRPLLSGCPPLGQPCPPSVEAAANVPPGTQFGGAETHPGLFVEGTRAIGASPDLGRIVLSAPLNLVPGFETAGHASLFEWSSGRLRPVSILPDGESVGESGFSSSLGGLVNNNKRGAISTEGDRVVFFGESSPAPHLYLRDMTLGKTVQLDSNQGGLGGGGEIEFQGANRDASKVFFTDTARLTPDSTAADFKPDLYMCEITVVAGEPRCSLEDLTADPARPAAVQGYVSSFSADGRFVYFVADGVLTTGEGAVPGNCVSAAGNVSGECNLYVRDTVADRTRLIAQLSGNDSPDWANTLLSLTARTSSDGRYFAFMSQRSLTGYDNRDAVTGQADQEVFLYDSQTGEVHCASCNPTGARPRGVQATKFPGLLVDSLGIWGREAARLAGSIPGWTTYGGGTSESLYQPRYLSDSGRLFFNAADALVPQDTDGTEDVYQYEPSAVGSCTGQSPTFGPASGGCVDLISSGTSPEESAFLDASENGDDVFFLTASRLTPKDVDTAFDIYDARSGGGEPPLASPPACEGDACQLPATPPLDATPGSLTFNGAGNVKECPKGKKLQKGKCVKKHQKKAKKHKKGKKKNSNKNKAKGKKQKPTNSEHGGHK
jgi:DNA-binding beta-propeller fold protein YncE